MVGILAVHGLTATPREFERIVKLLPCDFHYTTLNGHDTKPEDLRGVTAGDWYEKARKDFEKFRATHEHLLILGMSTGSLIAQKLATEYDLDGIICVATPLHLHPSREYPLAVVGKIANRFPNFKIPTIEENNGRKTRKMERIRDKMISNSSEQPGKNYNRMPINAPLEMYAGARHIESIAHNIRVPTLLVSNVHDPTVLEPKSTNRLASLIPDVEVMMFGADGLPAVPFHTLVDPPFPYNHYRTPEMIAEKIMQKWSHLF